MPEPGNLRRHSLWMMYGHGAAIAFQALYFVLIGRTLGSREYGAFVAVVALINVLSQFSSFGMEMILLRDISRDHNAFSVTWGKALRISIYGFLALLIVASCVGHFVLPTELRPLIPYIALSDALFGKIVQLASRAFQGAGQLACTAKLTALSNVARAVTALILFSIVLRWHVHAGVYLWTRMYWLSSMATGIVAFAWITRSLGWPAYKAMNWREVADGFSFSLSNSSISVYNDIDKTFLAGSGQLNAAGIYAAAYRVIDVASIPIYAIYTAASPQFFRDGEHGVSRSALLARKLLKRTVPYGIALAIVLFLAAPWMPLVVGQSFHESAAALRWLCLLPLIRGMHYAWGTTITGSSSQWYRTSTQIAAALLNLLLNMLLIPRWSWHGAAIASLITDGLLAISNWIIVSCLRAKEQVRQPVSSQAT
jgi:O-antigen/teichoic acid export membrane protein